MNAIKTKLKMSVKHTYLRKGFLPFLATAMLITGCSKEDINEEINDPNSFTPIVIPEGTIVADMGDPLSKAIYVDFNTGVTTSVDVSTWDLAFESNGSNVSINTAKKANILNTGSTDFASVTSTDASTYPNDYMFEQTNGDLSMSAMGDWTNGSGASKNEVYVLDMGTDASGSPLGFKKLVVLNNTTATSFEIKYADMDGSNEVTQTISLSSSHNFTYYSLSTGSTVSVEPEKTKWDVVLTPISVKTGPPFAPVYRLAASAQTNSYENVGVSVDDPWSSLPQDDDPASDRNTKDISSSNYDNITIANYTSAITDADAIGRSWLQILQPHSAGVYKVYDFMTFILKDPAGQYFKIRFIAYKDPNTGSNGVPQIEYKQLQ